MQGLNLVIYKTGKIPADNVPAGQSIYNDSYISISKNLPYSYYPVNHWETDNYLFITEGYFFEWTDWKNKIEQFANKLFKSDDRAELTKQQFADIDGEFIGVIYNKHQRTIIVFNDVLARFPLYIAESKDYTIISRNIGFISSHIRLSANRLAFLETLTFRYSLGSKTIYNEIERIPGGTIIELAPGVINRQQYHEFNYEDLIDENFNINDALSEIESLFKTAIKNRSNLGDLNIVSLSGGLDSRAVAAGFKKNGLNPRLVCFSDKQGSADTDIKYAGQIASAFNMPLEVVDLPNPSRTDFELLFNIKHGLNGLDMAFILNFFRHLTSLSDRPVLFTGDGGDRVFPDLSPSQFLRSADATVEYIINAYSKMNVETAARILGQDKEELRRKILRVLETYPEKDWRQKYIHFTMESILANLIFEGEDRNRYFLPSGTPFYNVKLFKKLMSAPARLKKNHDLYRRFLLSLAPELSKIPNANWGFDLSQQKKIRWAYFKQELKKTSLGKKLKRILQKDYNCIQHQNTNEHVIFNHLISNENLAVNFDVDYIKKLKHFSQEDLFRVMTLNKAINYFPLNFAAKDGKEIT